MKTLDPIKQAQAVTALKASLEALGAGDDDELLIDSIEGETTFFEAVDHIMEANAEDLALVEAIDSRIEGLKARKDRFKKRVEVRKALLEQAFIEADLPKVERPLGTLYLSNRAPKVIIETEADVPARYWKPSDPVLDQKQLLADLKDRRAGLEAIISADGAAARAAAADAFCQRFLTDDEARQLRVSLDGLDDPETHGRVADLLRTLFANLPGATLSTGVRSLSIRSA